MERGALGIKDRSNSSLYAFFLFQTGVPYEFLFKQAPNHVWHVFIQICGAINEESIKLWLAGLSRTTESNPNIIYASRFLPWRQLFPSASLHDKLSHNTPYLTNGPISKMSTIS